MNKCGHDDCFTCPFADCILEDVAENVRRGKRGRIPLDPEERKRRRREASKRYYYAHKAACNEKNKRNYYKRKERETATA